MIAPADVEQMAYRADDLKLRMDAFLTRHGERVHEETRAHPKIGDYAVELFCRKHAGGECLPHSYGFKMRGPGYNTDSGGYASWAQAKEAAAAKVAELEELVRRYGKK